MAVEEKFYSLGNNVILMIYKRTVWLIRPVADCKLALFYLFAPLFITVRLA